MKLNTSFTANNSGIKRKTRKPSKICLLFDFDFNRTLQVQSYLSNAETDCLSFEDISIFKTLIRDTCLSTVASIVLSKESLGENLFSVLSVLKAAEYFGNVLVYHDRPLSSFEAQQLSSLCDFSMTTTQLANFSLDSTDELLVA